MKKGILLVDPGARLFDHPASAVALQRLKNRPEFADVEWVGWHFPEDGGRIAEVGRPTAPWVARWEPLRGTADKGRRYLPVIWPAFEFLREAQYVADHVRRGECDAVIYPDLGGLGLRIEQARLCDPDGHQLVSACLVCEPTRLIHEQEDRFMDTAEALALDWTQRETVRLADVFEAVDQPASAWAAGIRASGRRSRREDRQDAGAVDISVVIAHFNCVSLLQNQLLSLAEQVTAASWEVIVVDDASADAQLAGLKALVNGYADRFSISLVESPRNGGPSAARNRGTAKARGKFIVFADCDNESLPQMLQTLWSAIRASGCDLMSCYNLHIPAAAGSTDRLERGRATHTYAPVGACGGAAVVDNFVGDANAIVRAAAFRALNGFTEQHMSGEDHEFFVRAMLAGYSLSVVPQPLFLYRGSTTSYSQQSGAYRNRMRTLRACAAHFHDQGDVLRGLFELAEGAYGNPTRVVGFRNLYRTFAGMPDDLLLQWLDGRTAGTADTYLQPMIQRLRPLVARWEEKGSWPRRLFIYGAGEHTKALLALFPALHRILEAFIDSRGEGVFLDRAIVTPAECAARGPDVIIYSSRQYEREMYENLRHLACEHILVYEPGA